MDIDLEQYKFELDLFTQSIAVINHSLFWSVPQNFNQVVKKFCICVVMPSTEFGLEWQVRSAYEKVLIPNQEKYFDFCFNGPTKQQDIQHYIATHGREKYNRYNVFNMRIIFQDQQKQMLNLVEKYSFATIDLEDLVLRKVEKIHNVLTSTTKLNISLDHVDQVLDTWQQKHWDHKHTLDWCYSVNNLVTDF